MESIGAPRVSIILPSYNRESVIAETLDSIQAQTFRDLEVLVIDDCSTDSTRQIVERYTASDVRFSLYCLEVNSGAPACRNYGLERAMGDYVNFVDSDDLLHPEKLAKQVAKLDEGGADFVVCQVAVFRGDFDKTLPMPCYGNLTGETRDAASYLDSSIRWATIAPLWRKRFLMQIGGFRENLTCFQDWELNLRALCSNPEVAVIDQVLGYYRSSWSDDQITSLRKKKLSKGMFYSRLSIQKLLNADQELLNSCRILMTQNWQAIVVACFRNGQIALSIRAARIGMRIQQSYRESFRFARASATSLFSSLRAS